MKDIVLTIIAFICLIIPGIALADNLKTNNHPLLAELNANEIFKLTEDTKQVTTFKCLNASNEVIYETASLGNPIVKRNADNISVYNIPENGQLDVVRLTDVTKCSSY